MDRKMLLEELIKKYPELLDFTKSIEFHWWNDCKEIVITAVFNAYLLRYCIDTGFNIEKLNDVIRARKVLEGGDIKTYLVVDLV